MADFKRVKGTVDFYPEDEEVKRCVFGTLASVAGRFGFRPVEAPALEELKLLTEKEGEEIVSQIFTLDERGSEKLALRFDLTVPLARMFIAKQRELSKPVKWFYLTRMWRYEAPQKGRLREFYQFGVEVFGSTDPLADAEVINLACDALLSLGLKREDFVVNINNRKLVEGILEEISEAEDIAPILRIIDKMEKISESEFDKELTKVMPGERISDLKLFFQSGLGDLKSRKLNEKASKGLAELEEVMGYVKGAVFSPSTIRGLSYYNGTVFEIFDSKKKFRAICGGGRYDNMIKQFGGEPAPATGFGMGYSTLSLLLDEKRLVPRVDSSPDYFIGIIGEESKSAAYGIARKLRLKTSVEISLSSKNVGNQLKYANQIKAKKVIVVGPDEIKSGKVRVKDMSTGNEEEALISSL